MKLIKKIKFGRQLSRTDKDYKFYQFLSSLLYLKKHKNNGFSHFNKQIFECD